MEIKEVEEKMVQKLMQILSLNWLLAMLVEYKNFTSILREAIPIVF